MGDLKILKQQLIRYDSGEVAHIENVMKGEARDRDTRRSREIQTMLSSIAESEQSQEKDLQTTERFELENEIERSSRSQESIQAGVSLTAAYGPVSISAYARYGSETSTEQANRTANRYAKETVEQAVHRVKERVRTERTTRTIEIYEEKNHHGFINQDAAAANISGIYCFVDKFYRQKLVNYGKRLMYEFMVPEPAAFVKAAAAAGLINGDLPDNPSPPTTTSFASLADWVYGRATEVALRPDAIDATSYQALVQEYDADGVRPPPPDRLVLARGIVREASPQKPLITVNLDVDVPKGYAATSARVQVVGTMVPRITVATRAGDGDVGRVTGGGLLSATSYVMVGQEVFTSGLIGETTLTLAGETGALPVTVIASTLDQVGVHVEIVCRLTAQAKAEWQLETYAAIMTAYRRKRLDYEEAVAASRVQGGVAIQGRNPEINRQVERTELQRACIHMWLGGAWGIGPAVSSAGDPEYPETDIDAAVANAPRIQFLEQSFDWANMTYQLYPYFYGRRELWMESYGLEDTDPLFEAFLCAGAARVLVPVHPEFSAQVLYFQQNERIFEGEDVPSFPEDSPDGPLFNDFLADLSDMTDVVEIDREIELSEDDELTWTVKVPTSLVHLQSSMDLPDREPIP